MDSVDWDPMLSDYQDAQFNRYNQGVGRDFFDGSWRGAKLFVDNFPVELGQEGLINLFSECGHVIEAILKPSNRADKKLTFGFVTMDSAVSAENAISRWNQRKFRSGTVPLKVMPALTDEEKKRRIGSKEMETEFLSSIKGNFNRDFNREDDIMSSVSMRHEPMYHSRGMAPRNPGLLDRVGPSRFGGRGFLPEMNNYLLERPGFYNMGRGRVQAFVDSQRFMRGMNQDYPGPFRGGRGRGQLYHNERAWQNPNPRGDGFSFGRGLSQPKETNIPRRPQHENLKICVNCGKEGSNLRCGACKMYYCSPQCQRKDWPNHREICLDISIHNFKVRTEMELKTSPSSDLKSQQNTDLERGSISSGHGGRNFRQNDKSFESDGEKPVKTSRTFKKSSKGYESECGGRNSGGMNFKQADKSNGTDKEAKGRYPEKNNDINTQDLQKGREKKGTKVLHNTNNNNHIKTSNNNNDNNNDKDNKQKDDKYENDRKNTQGKVHTKKKQGQDKWQQKKKTTESDYVGDEVKKSLVPKGGAKSPQKTVDVGSKATNMDGSGDASCDLVGQTIDVDVSGKCFISHYESPSKLWIIMKEDICDFFRLSDDYKLVLDDMSMGSVKRVKAGDLYCLIHEGFWTRVKVVTVNGDKIFAFFPDIGKQETVSISELYVLDDTMRILPAQAVCCCLGNIRSKGKNMWNEKAKKVVEEWLGDPYVKELSYKVVGKRGNSHALEISYEGEDLSEILISQGLAESSAAEANLPKLSNNVVEEKPKNVKMERFMAKDLKNQTSCLEVDEKVYINITDFESPSHFTGHIITPETKEAKSSIEKIMQKMDLDKCKPYSPVQGELVLAKYSEDQTWYRSEVIDVSGENFQVLFVDYGNQERLTSKNIRHISDKTLLTFPALTAHLALWGVNPNVKTEDVIDEIGNLLSDFAMEEGLWSVVVKDKRDSSVLVDFVSWAKNDSLSSLLNEKLSPKKKSPMAKIQAAVSPKAGKDPAEVATIISADSLPADKNSEVVINFVNSCSSFYVMLTDHHDKLATLMWDIHTKMESIPLMKNPVIGSLVIIQYDVDKMWYRAEVKSIKNKEKCVAFFMDYGNVEEVAIKDLRQLPQWASVLPSLAIHCGLNVESVKLLPDADIGFKSLEGKIVSVSVLKQGTDKCVVKMLGDDGSDLLELMVGEDAEDQKAVEEKKSSPPKKEVKGKTPSPSKNQKSTSGSEQIINIDPVFENDEPILAAVCHIESLCDFYISGSKQEELAVVMTHLQTKAPSGPLLKHMHTGALCTAQFEEDDIWYRAKISSVVNDEMCIVQFIDYGNSQKTRKSCLRELPESTKSLSAMAIPCCFKEFESHLGSDGNDEVLSTIQGSKDFYKLRSDLSANPVVVTPHGHKSGVTIVSLTDPDGNDILKKHKISSHLAPTLADIPEAAIKDSSFDVIFTNMENLSEFCCQRKDDNLEKLLELSETLHGDLTNVSPGSCKPVVNGVYGCLFDNTWYRCVVEKITGKKVTVRYIDWGNMEEREASDLRPLQPNHLAYPVSLLRCRLHGVEIKDNSQENVEEYIKILNDRIETNRLCLDIKDKEGDFVLVSLSIVTEENSRVNIADDLVEIGIAESLKKTPSVTSHDETKKVEQTPQEEEEAEEEEEDEDDKALRELQRQMEEIRLRKTKKK